MTSTAVMTYSVVSRGLRPVRVAIVFDGGAHWSYWARRALYLANQVWGGAGFALVPHQGGEVDSVLLHACRAFDPDHVVAFPLRIEDYEYFEPGKVRITGADGEPLTGQERADALANDCIFQGGQRPGDTKARDLVASVCSPYQQTGGSTPFEIVRRFDGPSREFPSATNVPGAYLGQVLQCPHDWGGLLGAAVASYAGVVDPPDPAAVEPNLKESVRQQLTRWLLRDPNFRPVADLLWSPTVVSGVVDAEIPLAHKRTMTGLVPVFSGPSGMRPAVAVLGDTAEDFALARLWDLTYGVGVWLPTVLGTQQDPLPFVLTSSMSKLLDGFRGWPGKLMVTSISLPDEEIERIHDRLSYGVHNWSGVEPDTDELSRTTPATDLPWTRTNTAHLAVAEQFDDVLTVPTVIDENGSRVMVAPLPPPIVRDPQLAAHSDLDWHVDITWHARESVLGRGLLGSELIAPSTSSWHALARSARHGISHSSRRFDFVEGGIQSINRIARPALRDLSLAAWVTAKAAEHGLTARIGDAGQRTAQLQRMLGGRKQFVELFGGPLLPALHALHPVGSSSPEAYPDGGGVRLGAGCGVLSFAGICARVPALEQPQVRERLDEALRAGVAIRGLVLQCQTCEEVQFQQIDKLGQVWTCTRCDAANHLDKVTWKKPTGEPIWFYDLHPVARHLLRDHGDVSALLAAYLMAQGKPKPRPYHDITEIEFVENTERRVEVDLIAYHDDILTVAECKSTDHLGSTHKVEMRAEVTKKCQAASWLQADQLMFATTESTWTTSAQNAIRDAVTAFPWPPLGSPTVLLITGLRGLSPELRAVALNPA
ncbi:hypothetical protein [Nocardia sp. NPDC049149]|uniref:hypothetical protein n=1 Tax=Nocardia sp. NPDC049149 TaxID=3364315 RepID=UPI003714ABA6